MADLSSGDWHQTAGGLSGWNSSVHSDFTTPSAAGFTTLVTDSGGNAVDIALTFNPNVAQHADPGPAPRHRLYGRPHLDQPGRVDVGVGVVWNADVIGGFSASQFQLTGTVANMVPECGTIGLRRRLSQHQINQSMILLRLGCLRRCWLLVRRSGPLCRFHIRYWLSIGVGWCEVADHSVVAYPARAQ